MPSMQTHKGNLQQFINQTISVLKQDPRFCGLALAGSWNGPDFDQYSDLDVVLVSRDHDFESVMQDRMQLATAFGKLVSAFTGEHVGEHRLLICLYSPPLIHVDLKFVALKDFFDRIENPTIEWELDQVLTQIIASTTPRQLAPNYQWIEDRFWTWVHYGAVKIARGEIFESIGVLDFLRSAVIAPMAMDLQKGPVRGMRRIEQYLPDFAQRLEKTIPVYNAKSCVQALANAVDLYQELRTKAMCQGKNIKICEAAENEAITYLQQLKMKMDT